MVFFLYLIFGYFQVEFRLLVHVFHCFPFHGLRYHVIRLWIIFNLQKGYYLTNFRSGPKRGGQASGNDRKVSCRGGVRFHKKMSFDFYANVCSLISRDLLHIFCLYVQISVVSFFLAKHFRHTLFLRLSCPCL